MIAVCAFACSLTAFALLFLAMTRHQQDWLKRSLPNGIGQALRAAGFVLLGMTLAWAMVEAGWSYGLVLWLGQLTLAAAIVTGINAYRQPILAKVRARCR